MFGPLCKGKGIKTVVATQIRFKRQCEGHSWALWDKMYYDPTRGRGRYKRGQETERKTEKFFVWKMQKNYMGNCRGRTERGTREGESAGEGATIHGVWAERGRVTSDLGSKSPKSRRHMFGKGGPRPKAQAKTPVLLTGMTSVTRVPVFAAVKTERREGSG